MRVITLCALLLSTMAHAQSWQVFDMGNSDLPSNRVNAIVEDAQGNLWVGTDWGLAKYDGFDWEVFQVDNSDLPDNDIRALAINDQGQLLIGTFLHGLVIKEGNAFTEYNTNNSDMPADQVRCITVDHHDHAWIGTVDGLAWYDGVEWRVYNDQDVSYNGLELPGNNIASIAVRQDDLVCIGTLNAGITYLTDTSVTVFNTFDDGLPDNTGLGMAIDSDGKRWVASPAGALMRHEGLFTNGFWLIYNTSVSNIPSNALNDVIVDPNQTKIIATQNAGVAFFTEPSSWVNYNEGNSLLPDDVVLTLYLDQSLALWAGTETGGLARFDHISGLNEHPVLKPYLYPTVSDRWVQVEAFGNVAKYSVFQSSGKLVSSGSIQGSSPLDVSELASGIYLLVLELPQGRVPLRFIKR